MLISEENGPLVIFRVDKLLIHPMPNSINSSSICFVLQPLFSTWSFRNIKYVHYISFIFLHLGPKGGEEGGQISRWAREFLIYPKGRARNCFKFHESLLLAGISYKGLWLVGISYESIRDSVKSWVREFIASRHPCGERYADVDRISATAPSTRREGGSPAKN